jgi:lipoprotein NlpI
MKSLLAAALLSYLVTTNPGFGADSFDEAARVEMLARFAAQERAFDEQLAKTPDSIALASGRGDVRLFRGRFAEAVADYEKMIALDPSQDAPHWRLGIAYYFVGEFEKSARQFEKYHAYDPRDRENGIWKFLAQARGESLEKARREMLVYERFDREPFPSLYEMFAGKKTIAELFAEIDKKSLGSDGRVSFFANYYAGLHAQLSGDTTAAREHLTRAVDGAWKEKVHRELGYMWQVARLQREALERTGVPAAAHGPPAR